MKMPGRGFDPASRYDPSTMSRIADDDELDDRSILSGTHQQNQQQRQHRDEENPNDEYDNYNPFHGKWSPKRLLTMATILAILAAIAVGIGVALGGRNNNNSNNNNSGEEKSLKLPPPPIDLFTKCSPKSLETSVGYNSCQSICIQSECCHLPLDQWPLTCADDAHEENCAMYAAACQHLYNYDKADPTTIREVNVPPAPPNLPALCAPSELAFIHSYSKCEDACLPGECCLLQNNVDDTGALDCHVLNPSRCPAYAPCSILKRTNSIPPPPPPPSSNNGSNSTKESVATKVKKACSVSTLTSTSNVDDCEQICDPALCCFVSTTTTQHPDSVAAVQQMYQNLDSCLTTKTFAWCEQYSACQVLNHVDEDGFDSSTSSNNNEPKNAVDMACSQELGIDCKNICSPAQCCFDDSIPNACAYAQGALDCTHYQACSVLHQSPSSSSSSSSSSSGITITTSTSSPTMTPTTTINKDETLFRTAEQVVEACSIQNLNTLRGRSECQHLCNDRGCCFESNIRYNCIEEQHEECLIYAACENLFGLPSSDTNTMNDEDPLDLIQNYTTTTTKSSSSSISETQAQSIAMITNQKCSQQTISKSIQAFTECHDLCQPYLCCFSNNINENCYKDHPYDCDVYGICITLINPSSSSSSSNNNNNNNNKEEDNNNDNNDISKDMIDDACDEIYINDNDNNNNEIGGGLSDCHLLCSNHLCCFSPIGLKSNCIDTLGQEECDLYQSCSILVQQQNQDQDDTITDPSNLLQQMEDVCVDIIVPGIDYLEENYDNKKEECETICRTRKCCTISGAGSCIHTDPEFCKEFDICKQALETSIEQEISTMLCDPDVISTINGFQHCHEICEPYLCCFTPHLNENCYDDHPELCDNYGPCNILLHPPSLSDNDNNEDTITKTMVNEACTTQAIETSELLEICHGLCAEHLCCIAPPGMKSNCWDTVGLEICDIYHACSVLTKDDDDDEDDEDNEETTTTMIDQVCIEEIIDNDKKRQDCMDLCDTRSCCFTNGLGSCKDTDKEWCEEFAACNHIEENIEATVGITCNPSTLQTIDGLSKCLDLCQPYLCCFSDINDGEKNCLNEHPSQCYMYRACNILTDPYGIKNNKKDNEEEEEEEEEDMTTETVVTKEQVTKACDLSTMTHNTLQECHYLCAEHLCCFVSNGMKSNCADTNDDCDIYAPCSILKDGGANDDDGEQQPAVPIPGGGGSKPNIDLNKVVDNINVLCTENGVKDETTRQQCGMLCATRACCFIRGPGNCYTMDKGWCDEVGACEILEAYNSGVDVGNENSGINYDEPVGGFLPTDAESACQPEALKTDAGKRACDEVCQSRACCFTSDGDGDGNDCENDFPGWCTEFQACKNRKNESGGNNMSVNTSGNLKNELMTQCTAEKLGDADVLAQCMQKCADVFCCFESDPSNNCSVMREKDCDEHQGCAQVYAFLAANV